MISVVNKRSYSKFKNRCKFYDRLSPKPNQNDDLPSLYFLKNNDIKLIDSVVTRIDDKPVTVTNVLIQDIKEFDFKSINYLYSIDKFIHAENGYIYKVRFI